MTSNTRSNVRRTVVILLCIMVVFVGATVSRILRTPDAGVPQVAPDRAELQELGVFIHPVPRLLQPVEVINEQGQPFTTTDFIGRWNLIFLGYTHCPDICPTTLALFKQLRAGWQTGELARIRYVLLSADPERDTPQRLRDYLAFFHPDFVGLTGRVEDVDQLAKQLSSLFAKVPQADGDYLVDHSANIMIINPAGQYVGFIRPPHSVKQIKRAMEMLAAAN